MNHLRPVLVAAIAGMASSASVAGAQTVFNGSPVTDMSGAACRPKNNFVESNNVYREIWNGTSTSSSVPTNYFMTLYCPLNRRNTTRYGLEVASRDRVRMTSLRVRLYDGTTTSVAWCNGYIGTGNGSTYWSPSRYACGSTDGCATPPANSYVGERELYWSNPFGTTVYLNLGAVNVGAECSIPKSSNVLSLRAAYSGNQ